MSDMILAFPSQRPLADVLARALRVRLGQLDWRRFPDGESLVTVDPRVEGADLVIVASLLHPDELALPLRFAAETARALGARSIGLVAPYLGYMRQDARFHAGEAVSASLFARFLQESFDWLVTVDPHLHRNASLARLFDIPATNIAAAPAVAAWIQANVPAPAVIGPDAESAQWVGAIAGLAGAPWQVLQKVRHGDREVELGLPDASRLQGRTPVLVDDIASSGATLAAAVGRLRELGLPPPVCVVTHAVFAEGAQARIEAAGAARIVSTDTVPHASNGISIEPLLAGATAARLAAARTRAGDRDSASPAEWFAGDAAVP